MRTARSASFVALVATFVYFFYTVPLRAEHHACNPPGYGYGYVTVWDDGSCDSINQQQLCWANCNLCFNTEDQGEAEFCEDNYDPPPAWYDMVCWCEII
jgi:hypothetical protein